MTNPTTLTPNMSFITKSIFFFTLLLIVLLSSTWTDAATFTIQNNCPITLWPAAFPEGGGRQLDHGHNWTLDIPIPVGTSGRIWARTGCSFDGEGRGRCQTGDCNGLLQCQNSGAAPVTLAEFYISQPSGQNLFDISVVDGFNVPIEISPQYSKSCTRAIRCVADINGQCPSELRTPGGCNGPCAVFRTNQYCCTDMRNCGPTDYSRFFKKKCGDAYSYPYDDANSSLLACPGEIDYYMVVFCP